MTDHDEMCIDRNFDVLEEDDLAFWTCPATGVDCRSVEKPALAIIFVPDGISQFQMYSTWDLASNAGEGLIECDRA